MITFEELDNFITFEGIDNFMTGFLIIPFEKYFVSIHPGAYIYVFMNTNTPVFESRYNRNGFHKFIDYLKELNMLDEFELEIERLILEKI
jgi:hypothetical protein